MDPNPESILARLGLPDGFGYALLMLALALLLAPYLKGSDFGLVKIPNFEPPVRRTLRIAGPVLMAAAILAHVPILAATDMTPIVQQDGTVQPTAATRPVEVGDEVLAPQGDGRCLYPATVLSHEDGIIRFRFAFGRDGQTPSDRLVSMAGNVAERISVADRVFVRLPPQAVWAPGEIKEIREGRAMVALDPGTDCADLYERPYVWTALAGQNWRLLEGEK